MQSSVSTRSKAYNDSSQYHEWVWMQCFSSQQSQRGHPSHVNHLKGNSAQRVWTFYSIPTFTGIKAGSNEEVHYTSLAQVHEHWGFGQELYVRSKDESNDEQLCQKKSIRVVSNDKVCLYTHSFPEWCSTYRLFHAKRLHHMKRENQNSSWHYWILHTYWYCRWILYSQLANASICTTILNIILSQVKFHIHAHTHVTLIICKSKECNQQDITFSAVRNRKTIW